jgi:hypothetical protein
LLSQPRGQLLRLCWRWCGRVDHAGHGLALIVEGNRGRRCRYFARLRSGRIRRRVVPAVRVVQRAQRSALTGDGREAS